MKIIFIKENEFRFSRECHNLCNICDNSNCKVYVAWIIKPFENIPFIAIED